MGVMVTGPKDVPILFVAATQTTSSSTTVTAPAGAQVGDVLVAVAAQPASTISTPGAFTWPAGWTVQDTAGSTALRIEVATRTHDGSASWSVTGSSANVCAAYSNVDAAAPLLAKGISSVASSTSSQATPSVANTDDRAVRVACFASANSATARTWDSYSPTDTERGEGNGTNSTLAQAALVDSAGPVASGSGSVTGTLSGSAARAAAWIGYLKPAG